MPRRSLASLTLALAAPLAFAASAPAQTQTDVEPLEVVADGLANPRGLTVAPDGSLYVAEAGRGGSGPCLASPEGGQACAGATGSITRVEPDGDQRRVATGLPSLAAEGTGANANGPGDVALRGGGRAYVPVGLGQNPALRSRLGRLGPGFAQLHDVDLASGRARPFADIGAYEARANPDGGDPDTNPTSVTLLRGRRVVADAGANALFRVSGFGGVSTLAVFPSQPVARPPFLPPGPPIPSQAVPTSVVAGPDGALYVGQLTGFPFPVGGASVFRVRLGSSTPTVYRSGFTNVIDIGFGPDRSLYVLQIRANGLLSPDRTGLLVRVRPDGTRTTVAREGLVEPGGLAVAEDGDLYVSNFGTSPEDGEVVRIPAPE